MKEISTADTRKHMAELLNRAAYGGERFVVTRHGKELAAIVPLSDVTLLDRLRSLLDRKEFEAAVEEVRTASTRSWEDVRRDLDI
ncbi:MAG: type II toxin-antitoxin system Phd/YefM family antitoxin [Longimicrobiales bacterium]|nr:type II toxin-antitoxin system Phd/YefM family antitoxin [Longimicrobiales bacterium]